MFGISGAPIPTCVFIAVTAIELLSEHSATSKFEPLLSTQELQNYKVTVFPGLASINCIRKRATMCNESPQCFSLALNL